MKRTVFIALLCICLTIGVTNQASAILYDFGFGITQDDRGTADLNDDMYWFQDLSYFVGMIYDEQITAINNIDIPGVENITSWHMASYTDVLTMWNTYSYEEMANAFIPSLVIDYTEPGEVDEFIQEAYVGRYDRELTPGYHYEVILHHNINPTNNSVYLPPGYTGGINIGTANQQTFLGAYAVAYYQSPVSVPEPSTLLLLGTGLVGLVGFRRKFNV